MESSFGFRGETLEESGDRWRGDGLSAVSCACCENADCIDASDRFPGLVISIVADENVVTDDCLASMLRDDSSGG